MCSRLLIFQPHSWYSLTLCLRIQTQHYTVDHLALRLMKNGANSVMPCELQDTWHTALEICVGWYVTSIFSSSVLRYCITMWIRSPFQTNTLLDIILNYKHFCIGPQIYYKFQLCLFACVLCFVTNVTNLNISAKWSQIITKPSAYFRIGLLSWLIMSVCVHMCACTHSRWKRAWNFGQKTNPHTSGKN